jgi:DNA-binding CsgD family transcriptional regulator
MMSVEPPKVDWKAVRQHLSKRENQVLELWLHGCGIRRTTLLLGIKESTVRTHRQRILLKLGDHLPDIPKAC